MATTAILVVWSPRLAVAQPTLANVHVRAEFDADGLTALIDRNGNRRFALVGDRFVLTINGSTYSSVELGVPERIVAPGRIVYSWRVGQYEIAAIYELRPDWHFVSKQLRVTAPARLTWRVQDITLLRITLAEPPVSVFRPTSARPSLGTLDYGAAIRFGDRRSLLLVAQNPFVQVALEGTTTTLRYAPDMEWKSAYGPFRSDRALIAPVSLSGRMVPAQMTPEWRPVADGAPGLDQAEVDTFTGMVRAFLLYKPKVPLNVFVGWCANDYQIDVGLPEGRAEYRRVFDQAAAVGAQYVLYAPSNSALSRREASVDAWSWEHVLWLGLGQQLRRNEWNPRTSAVPSSVTEMVSAAKARQLGLLAYVYPVLPFTQDTSWLVRSKIDPTKAVASLGSRALQDWLVDELVAFHDRTGIAGYAFDYTFLTYDGTSRYAQWWGWRRVMEELRRRIPDIVIDGRQAYHQYGPWSWLAGSYPHPTFNDEQPESFVPYPDLHFDRVSANRERYTAYRYRQYEFTPSELVPGYMTHQTSRSDESDEMPSIKTPDRGVLLTSYRARDWDYLGWRYSVLSSVAVAGWNNVLNMLPARDSAEMASFSADDRAWLRTWLAFTRAHRELLRRTRPILGQPALGKVDGTAAIEGDHGFVFLFNPDAARLEAKVPLDASIGIESGARFVLREVHPWAGRAVGKPGMGYWSRGDTLSVALNGGSALVLEIATARTQGAQPALFGAPGSVRLSGGLLDITGVRGETGTSAWLTVVLPVRAKVARAHVNGVHVPLARVKGDVAELEVRFGGAPFGAFHPVIAQDSTFAGGTARGTLTIQRAGRHVDRIAHHRRHCGAADQSVHSRSHRALHIRGYLRRHLDVDAGPATSH